MIHLPDLLEALAQPLLRPGSDLEPTVTGAHGADWCPAPLKTALEALLSAPRQDLAVAHTGLFIVGRHGPTLHLETSAYRAGRLADPDTLAELEAVEAAVELEPSAVTSDHLGHQIRLLAALLRALAATQDPEGDPRHPLAQGLLERLLLPHLEALLAAYPASGDPYHRHLLEALRETARFTRDLLAD